MKAAVPDVEVIDAGADPPPSDLRADVLFGGWGPHSLEYAQHVDWVHLAGTGIDSYPREMFDGRIVTNAAGASAVPIAEFVLAAMLVFEKRLPETWIHEPPEHWNIAPLGWLNAHARAGGAGRHRTRHRRAGAAVRHESPSAAASSRAQPARRRRDGRLPGKLLPEQTTWSRRRRPARGTSSTRRPSRWSSRACIS
jgi:hypothetical protein